MTIIVPMKDEMRLLAHEEGLDMENYQESVLQSPIAKKFMLQ